MNDEAKKSRAMKRSESNNEVANEITGCSKKLNETHNKTNFKYTYEREELSQYLSQNATPNNRVYARERSYSNLKGGMIVNESASTYLGG